jgi:lysophospholipase L1-like esterase
MCNVPRVFCLLLLATTGLNAADKADYPFDFDPNPDRFSDQVTAFQTTDKANPPPKGAIVCTGSSSMRRWHPRIKDDLAGLTLLPRGFGGSHYSDVIHYVEELILKYEPRALLIYEGDNDANHGKSPQRVFHDFKYLAKLCRGQLPDLRFYVIGAKPSVARWAIAGKMQSANAMIEDYCRANEGFTYIDVWPALLDADGQPRPELFVEDMLHLNEAGYDLWASAIVPVVQRGEAGFE